MIQVLEKALRIVEFLGKDPRKAVAMSKIADSLSLDRGTCSHILKTLSARGFVEQEFPRSGYKLGYKLYHIIGHYVENNELTEIARKDVEALGSELNETAMLAINRNDMRVVLYHTIPNRSVVASTDMERSIYSACAGRVIMAYYSPTHLEKCLIRLGLPTEKEWPEIYQSENPEQHLANTLAAIKLRGYDIQYDHEVTGFAAPLFIDGHVIGSLGTYIPNWRLTDKGIIIKAMLHYAAEINRKLEKFSQI